MEHTFHVCIVINPATGTWQPGMCPTTQHIYWCLLKWRMHSTCAPVQHCHYCYVLFTFMYDLFVRHQRSCKGFTDDVSCFHHQSLWSEVSGEALRFDMLSGRWLRLSDPIIQCNMTKLSMLAVSLKWIIVFTKCFYLTKLYYFNWEGGGIVEGAFICYVVLLHLYSVCRKVYNIQGVLKRAECSRSL